MKMVEVVETSSHPINAKHGRMAVEVDYQPKVALSKNSSAKPILI
jgi:hypothetical protein